MANTDSTLDARAFLLLMAARMVGDFLYSWGGEEGDEGGYDCSGFVWTALRQTSRHWPNLYAGGRTTANELHRHYRERGCPELTSVEDLRPGCLVFYRKPGRERYHHVAIHAVTAPPLRAGAHRLPVGPIAFEAGGGDSDTTSPREALARSATVRLTATDVHGDVEWVALDVVRVLEE